MDEEGARVAVLMKQGANGRQSQHNHLQMLGFSAILLSPPHYVDNICPVLSKAQLERRVGFIRASSSFICIAQCRDQPQAASKADAACEGWTILESIPQLICTPDFGAGTAL